MNVITVYAGNYKGNSSSPDLSILFGTLDNEITWHVDSCSYVNSDHFPIIIETKEAKQPNKTQWDFKKADWDNWNRVLQQKLEVWMDECLSDTPDEATNRFVEILLDTAEEVLPKKIVNRHSKPFFTDKLKILLMDCRKANKAFKRRRDPHHHKLRKEAVKTFMEEYEKAKKVWWDEICAELKTEDTDTWLVVNKVLKGVNTAPVQPLATPTEVIGHQRLLNAHKFVGLYPSADEETSIFWQLQEECTYNFDDYTIAKRLEDVHVRRSLATLREFDEEFKEEVEKEVDDTITALRAQHPDTWKNEDYNSDVTEHEAKSIIDATKENSTPGPDKVHPKMIKKSDSYIVSAILLLIQICWQAAVFPTEFKKQNMIYLQKADKEDYHHEKSYRPISLTSILGKILEKFVARRLVAYLQSTDFFTNQPQFAYLKGLDTTQALLLMTIQVQEGFK